MMYNEAHCIKNSASLIHKFVVCLCLTHYNLLMMIFMLNKVDNLYDFLLLL